ncbi:hypothetical protein Pyn_35507 [Prunus yedoensis var. nudiflora]|uniref:Uncharacterized protein n=1 Tax=Prunus yedoensis var. nudiflora TaxID=2094558 RepID=A0A314U7A0_PRUYE|nr:hypothetical protein Pyn_35507 [Prunus yedoensis var. nudiflora]
MAFPASASPKIHSAEIFTRWLAAEKVREKENERNELSFFCRSFQIFPNELLQIFSKVERALDLIFE